MRHPSGSTKGMLLLLEVVVGFGIFAVAMLLVFGLFVSSQKATASSKNLTVATDLAREVMESQISAGYDSVPTIDQPPVIYPMSTVVNGVPITTNYTAMVKGFEEPSKAPPDDFDRMRVVVTISWPEGRTAPRQTQLETYLVK